MAGVVVKARFPRRRMAGVIASNLFRFLFLDAARNWVRNSSSTAPALGSMTVLLLMAGVIGLSGYALYNLEQTETAQASLIHVYLRDDATETQIFALINLFSGDARVASVGYTTKAEALQRAQSIPGLPQLADSTDSNPFPASLDVRVKKIEDVAAIDALARRQAGVDLQYPTSYDRGAYQRIQAVLFGTGVVGLAFLGLLGFVAVMVTMNSIKAAIHARRDEITIMQLVGAPRWMVRGPFVVEGAITGVLAGGVGGVITFGLTAAGIMAAAGAFTRFAPGVSMASGAVAGSLIVIAGVALGSGSSLISLRRHMES